LAVEVVSLYYELLKKARERRIMPKKAGKGKGKVIFLFSLSLYVFDSLFQRPDYSSEIVHIFFPLLPPSLFLLFNRRSKWGCPKSFGR